MSKNKLTIIMPAFNSMPYIKQAINSVINQNFKDWEMLISDDLSTDGTVEFLKKIKHKKIKVFFQKKNTGIFGNLKFLNSKAKTSIIKILCTDDYLTSNSLQFMFLFMEKFKSCNLMTCYDQNRINNRHVDNITLVNECFSKMGNKVYIKFMPKPSMIAFLAFGNLCGNLSKVTYRKIKGDINPVFDQKFPYAGDYNAWAKFSQKHGLYLIKKKLIYIRKHPKQASLTMNHKIKKKNDLYPQLSKIHNFLLKNISKKHHAYLRQYMILNNLPQRITSYIKCLISGDIKSAKKVFFNLPLKISILECFMYCVFFKFRNSKFNKLNRHYRVYITNIINNLENE